MSIAHSSSAVPRSSAPCSPAPWWRGAVLYQVYPRSFADSDGDGIGDLRGLTARLGYIADLGVDGLWISPFFPSPMRDFGYDVSDHCGVDPRFGTLADVDALLARAHALDLKVLIDQVWSHTAAEHPWFVESRSSRDNPRADWYVWADAKPDGSAPNNWQSWMGGPAWRWEPRRRQYHLHNFLPQMPDLNFHCAQVQEAILEIARFWLDRGVDGFRLDTANLYFHDRLLRDNPPLPPERAGESPVLMQRHLHNADQPETLAFLERLRTVMGAYGHGERMAVGEIGGIDGLRTMQDYTAGDRRLHTAYSFGFLGARPDATAVAAQLMPWQDSDGWPSWAFSNHDAPRVASRWGVGATRGFDFGTQSLSVNDADAITPETWMAMLLCLRGTIFLYQGEELGLTQSAIPFEQMQDPFGIANWPLNPGRDGCRTPMPWQAGAPNAGFSTGTPWLPVDPAHVPLAVDRQQADARSMLHTTRRLIALRRQHPALRVGDLDILHTVGATLLLRRRSPEETLWAAFNLSAHGQTMSIPEPLSDLPVWQFGGALLHDQHLYLPGGAAWIAVDHSSLK
jgi:alpha-glucosidase